MADKNYDPYYAKDGSVKCESLRDYFAAKAMQGDWATQSGDSGYFIDCIDTDAIDNAARLYYRMADAMLKARGEQ